MNWRTTTYSLRGHDRCQATCGWDRGERYRQRRCSCRSHRANSTIAKDHCVFIGCGAETTTRNGHRGCTKCQTGRALRYHRTHYGNLNRSTTTLRTRGNDRGKISCNSWLGAESYSQTGSGSSSHRTDCTVIKGDSVVAGNGAEANPRDDDCVSRDRLSCC